MTSEIKILKFKICYIWLKKKQKIKLKKYAKEMNIFQMLWYKKDKNMIKNYFNYTLIISLWSFLQVIKKNKRKNLQINKHCCKFKLKIKLIDYSLNKSLKLKRIEKN